MPVRLIQWGIVALATLVVGGISAVAAWMIKLKLADKRVAILGAQQVGKTTLLIVLRDGKLPRRVSQTLDSEVGGTFSMPVGDKKVDFEVLNDIPGNDTLGYRTWKEAFEYANYVWYVFRADLIAVGDPKTNSMVSDHLDALKDWVDKARGKKPKIILIGTFADLSPVYSQNLAEFRQSVASGESIKIGLVKLKNAKLVVGSLVREKDAASLIKNLRSHL